MDGWALLVAVLAFVVSGAALFIAWWQLLLQRDAAGGRGIVFGVRRPSRMIDRRGGVDTISYGYRVLVKLVGNDRHQVGVHLERNGRELEEGDRGYVEPPDLIHRMTCEHEPINWRFDLTAEDARDLWVVLSWVDPFGPAIRTSGFRCKLDPPNPPQYQEWHWFAFFRARRRFESWGARRRWTPAQRWLGKPRRLGKWRPYSVRELQPGQSPLHSQADRNNDDR
jgi:hypothetical protein